MLGVDERDIGKRTKGGCLEPVIFIKVNAAVLHEVREGPEPIGEGQSISTGYPWSLPRRVALAGHEWRVPNLWWISDTWTLGQLVDVTATFIDQHPLMGLGITQ